MSGPKVVRIVTREEVLAVCNGLFARLSAVIERWEKIGIRNEVISAEDVAAVRQRAAMLKALLARDEFLEVQKRVPEEIDWIEADIERRLETARQRKVEGRMKARRRQMLARDLLAVHAEAVGDAGLRGDLERLAQARDMAPAEAEAILSGALRVTVDKAALPDAAAPELAALARRLAEGTRQLNLDHWLAEQSLEHSQVDEVALALDAALADLEVIGMVDAASVFRARAEAIGWETATPQRRMRADTLLVDIGRAARQRRSWLEKARILEAAIAEAREVAGSVANPLIGDASLLLGDDAAEPQTLQKCADRLRQATEEMRRKLANEARRSALLSALAAAGYQAKEGLSTASPSDGRLVLRRAANPEAGVEVAIAAAGERVQMRPVRFAPAGSTADGSRDRDIETAWCGDFERMREVLKSLNAGLTIERALPVGSAAVMVMDAEMTPADRRTATPITPQTTTRRS